MIHFLLAILSIVSADAEPCAFCERMQSKGIELYRKTCTELPEFAKPEDILSKKHVIPEKDSLCRVSRSRLQDSLNILPVCRTDPTSYAYHYCKGEEENWIEPRKPRHSDFSRAFTKYKKEWAKGTYLELRGGEGKSSEPLPELEYVEEYPDWKTYSPRAKENRLIANSCVVRLKEEGYIDSSLDEYVADVRGLLSNPESVQKLNEGIRRARQTAKSYMKRVLDLKKKHRLVPSGKIATSIREGLVLYLPHEPNPKATTRPGEGLSSERPQTRKEKRVVVNHTVSLYLSRIADFELISHRTNLCLDIANQVIDFYSADCKGSDIELKALLKEIGIIQSPRSSRRAVVVSSHKKQVRAESWKKAFEWAWFHNLDDGGRSICAGANSPAKDFYSRTGRNEKLQKLADPFGYPVYLGQDGRLSINLADICRLLYKQPIAEIVLYLIRDEIQLYDAIWKEKVAEADGWIRNGCPSEELLIQAKQSQRSSKPMPVRLKEKLEEFGRQHASPARTQ